MTTVVSKSVELMLQFFFFKQKTAYEISLGLVGSEIGIRDRRSSFAD